MKTLLAKNLVPKFRNFAFKRTNVWSETANQQLIILKKLKK